MTTPRRAGSDPGERVPVYILAGGKSRRFGSDKARASYEGVPLLVTVAELLRPVASSITVVAGHAGAYDDLGLRTIGDVVPGMGPLGGLLAAIEDLGGDGWLFLCACDWVGLKLGWARALLAHRRDDTTAILYRSDRLEPLFALYRASIGPAVRDRLAGRDLSMRGLVSEIDAKIVAAPVDWTDATDLNSPRDKT